ncbi:MAG: hydroxyacylglutathione hydrolase family protein [Nanoarchaeota archaeon]
MLKLTTFKGGYDSNFSYILSDSESKEAAIIDTAIKPEILLKFVEENGLILQFAVVMHSHFDHRVGVDYYKKNNILLCGSEHLTVDIDKRLKDQDELKVGKYTVTVISAPGHTPDCILLYVAGKLFTTDVLFIDGCGRCDISGANVEQMQDSLEKIKQLPEETVIYPGHDYGNVPFATLGEQKKTNRFLQVKSKKETKIK